MMNGPISALIPRYLSRYPDCADVLRKYGAMTNLYEEFVQAHPRPLETLAGAGRPVSDPRLILTGPELRDLLNRLADFPSAEGSLARLARWLAGEAEAMSELAGFWSAPERFSETLAGRLQLDPGDVTLFFLFLLKPFYWRVREAWTGHAPPLSPSCPVCGSWPHFARLEQEQGRRFLACPVCESQWPFPRFTCPFCNREAKEHLYFTAEAFPAHRVELCAECHMYLKTVVEKESDGPLHLLLEDLVTTPLDEAASREGYLKAAGLFIHARPER
jgi:transcription elongation factor Elf1